MTKAQLHSTSGITPEVVKALAAYLRARVPRKKVDRDATGIINHEGRMNGYLDAVDDLLDSVNPEPKQIEHNAAGPYSAPAISQQNLNRP